MMATRTRFSMLNPGDCSRKCCEPTCDEPCSNPKFDVPTVDPLTSGYDFTIDPLLGIYEGSGAGYSPNPDGSIPQFGANGLRHAQSTPWILDRYVNFRCVNEGRWRHRVSFDVEFDVANENQPGGAAQLVRNITATTISRTNAVYGLADNWMRLEMQYYDSPNTYYGDNADKFLIFGDVSNSLAIWCEWEVYTNATDLANCLCPSTPPVSGIVDNIGENISINMNSARLFGLSACDLLINGWLNFTGLWSHQGTGGDGSSYLEFGPYRWTRTKVPDLFLPAADYPTLSADAVMPTNRWAIVKDTFAGYPGGGDDNLFPRMVFGTPGSYNRIDQAVPHLPIRPHSSGGTLRWINESKQLQTNDDIPQPYGANRKAVFWDWELTFDNTTNRTELIGREQGTGHQSHFWKNGHTIDDLLTAVTISFDGATLFWDTEQSYGAGEWQLRRDTGI